MGFKVNYKESRFITFITPTKLINFSYTKWLKFVLFNESYRFLKSVWYPQHQLPVLIENIFFQSVEENRTIVYLDMVVKKTTPIFRSNEANKDVYEIVFNSDVHLTNLKISGGSYCRRPQQHNQLTKKLLTVSLYSNGHFN